MTFHFCKCPTIPKTLSEIQFPRLIQLLLPGNKIKSIELLQTTSFPCLLYYNIDYLQLDNQIIKKDFSNTKNFTITRCHGMFQKQCDFLKTIIVKKHQDLQQLR
jgi:hypothetical protein